ncbi:MAG: succinate dehydrogenase, hydrophobic membrane anchor protein [Burkholderiales bacterium]|nr:succinate dehydrogenase, hydrophobic membrane anchor protein [Burkholderiales bacterium]
MTRRIVTGAHYGLRDWLAQRITALVLAVGSVVVIGALLWSGPITYPVWKELFSHGAMRVATLLVAVALAWHAWVGVRDILMDYIKPDGLRLALHVAVLLAIAGWLGWTVEILWG